MTHYLYLKTFSSDIRIANTMPLIQKQKYISIYYQKFLSMIVEAFL